MLILFHILQTVQQNFGYEFSVSEVPASTVTFIFCGESRFPKSNWNVRFVGELFCSGRECLATEERRGFAGDWNVGVSFRGSGEDESACDMLPPGRGWKQ